MIGKFRPGVEDNALNTFVGAMLDRLIFDDEQLGDLVAPQDLGWKTRTKAELAFNGRLGAVSEDAGAGARDFGIGGVWLRR